MVGAPSLTVRRVGLGVAAWHGLRTAPALLDPAGPLACIGAALDADGLALPVRADATSLFGPRGACLTGDMLWVADTGHHRLLGWLRRPERDGVAADWLIGQPDFDREGRNAKRAPDATTFNVPSGIARAGAGIAVADAWNHRVLLWRRMPLGSNVPADLVLGQDDFVSVEPNRGAATPSARSLFWPYGVQWDGERLWVADTGNRRVLMWRGLPVENGQPADLMLGQIDFACRDENGGGAPNAATMRWPHAIASSGTRLAIADAGNNRVMLWERVPVEHGARSDRLLGQGNVYDVDHNRGRYWPDARSLNMPYGVAATADWLLVADTANSRLLGWPLDAAADDAQALTGQHGFERKGDNRWLPAGRDSLCWPYAIDVDGDLAAIADSGNNRVLLWRLAPELRA